MFPHILGLALVPYNPIFCILAPPQASNQGLPSQTVQSRQQISIKWTHGLLHIHCKRDWLNSGAKQEFSQPGARILPALSWKSRENRVNKLFKENHSKITTYALNSQSRDQNPSIKMYLKSIVSNEKPNSCIWVTLFPKNNFWSQIWHQTSDVNDDVNLTSDVKFWSHRCVHPMWWLGHAPLKIRLDGTRASPRSLT